MDNRGLHRALDATVHPALLFVDGERGTAFTLTKDNQGQEMEDSMLQIPSFDDVLAAQARIAPHVHRTLVLTSRFINDLTGADLFFKCENFQRAGAFKARGASNAVFALLPDQAARGVATHSSGNHGTCLSYAAEPEQADDAARSFRAGHIIADDAPVTVADGLKVPLKNLTWHFVQRGVTNILTVSEQEIIDAMRLTWSRMKIIVEPSSAVPLAAILKNPDLFAGQRVGLIITGGNVDLDHLPWQ